MQSIFLCKAAVHRTAYRYWRPGLHDSAANLLRVPVQQLPSTGNVRAFLSGAGGTLTPIATRWSLRVPPFPLVGQQDTTPDVGVGGGDDNTGGGSGEARGGGSNDTPSNVGGVDQSGQLCPCKRQCEEDDENEAGAPLRPRKRTREEEPKEKKYKPCLRSYRIPIRPDKNARAAFRHMFAGVHATQNLAVTEIRKRGGFVGTYEIRDAVVPLKNLPPDKKWLNGIPHQPRSNKAIQITKAYNSNLEKKSAHGFEMQYSSWKKKTEMTMEFNGWRDTEKGVVQAFARRDGPQGKARTHGNLILSRRSMRFRDGVKIPEESLLVPFCDRPWLVEHLLENGLERAYRIMWNRRVNRWWLLVSIDINKVQRPIGKTVRIEPCPWTGAMEAPDGTMVAGALRNAVSLDPGVRTFQTTYDPSGVSMRLCEALPARLETLRQRRDKFRSQMKKYKEIYAREREPTLKPWWSQNQAQKQFLSNRIKRLRYHMHVTIQKMQNIVRWNHWDAVNVLFRRYNTVIIPEFRVKQLCRGLPKPVRRTLVMLSHYTFRGRLISRAEEDPDREVFVSREPGTTKTCCLCGTWHPELGSATSLECSGCHAHIDRDVNGAVGNFQCYLTVGQ